VQDDQPVVVVLRHPSGSLHAVVVCDVTPVGVVVMDPALGDYTTLPTLRFEDLWCRVQNEGLVISGARPAHREVSGCSE
jgi:predicted double-glycine peptidase